VKRAERSC